MGKHRKPPHRQARICACGDHGFVGLTKGHVALFDGEDIGLVEGRSWHTGSCSSGAYAVHTAPGRVHLKMHREIAKPDDDQVVDHENHDTLDNRKKNLRVCLQKQNAQHRRVPRITGKTSVFKGVSREGRKFRVHICANGSWLYVRGFMSEEAAAREYDRLATLLHKDFAVTNAMLGLLPPAITGLTEIQP